MFNRDWNLHADIAKGDAPHFTEGTPVGALSTLLSLTGFCVLTVPYHCLYSLFRKYSLAHMNLKQTECTRKVVFIHYTTLAHAGET